MELLSRSVKSDSLWPHRLQHARLLCPSPSPIVCWDSCPLSWWCHPTVSSSVASFSSCPQSFTASRSSPISQLFTSGGQSIGALVSALCLPIQFSSGLISFRIDWFDLLVLQRTLKSLLQHRNFKASILWHSAFFMVQLSHPTWFLEKPQLGLCRPLLAKWYLCFLTCCLGLSQLFFQGASVF